MNGRLALSQAQQNTAVRCLCGSVADRGAMIQCEVWSHQAQCCGCSTLLSAMLHLSDRDHAVRPPHSIVLWGLHPRQTQLRTAFPSEVTVARCCTLELMGASFCWSPGISLSAQTITNTSAQGDECGIWQHCSCVGLQPPKQTPEHFYCEICTCERANPFWRNSSSDRRMLLPPALLQPQQLPVSSGQRSAIKK